MRIYLSNIRPHWPIERQEAMLDKALPDWRRNSIYRDELSPRKRKSHGPADLADRETMLRPTSRRASDTVYVASLCVLAWTLSDLVAVLGSLSAKRTTLVSLDSGTEIPPDATPTQIAAASKAFEAACRRRKGDPGERGGDVSGRVRGEAARARAKEMAPFWCAPSSEFPTKPLLDRFKISRPTAILYLGKRADAQRAHVAGQKTAERNRNRSKTDD